MNTTPTVTTESTVQSAGASIDTVEQQGTDGAAAAKYTQAMVLRDAAGNLMTPLTERTGREILAELSAIRVLLQER